MKDPAFLFYSQDFYSGTRLMLPNERACYIDLLIYQHQNEFIPNNLDRVIMFCSGIDKATLKATLEAKFKQSDKGWYNERLRTVITERKEFKSKLSNSGKVGQFWKKIKASLKASEYNKIRKYLSYKNKEEISQLVLKIDYNNKEILKGWLLGLLKHIEDEDVNEDKENKNIPTYQIFSDYAKEKSKEYNLAYNDSSLKQKYDAWVVNNWKDGNNKKILNWKSKILNTLKYIFETKKKTQQKNIYAVNHDMANDPDRNKF